MGSICSCKKNKDAPFQSYMRFKLNGVQVECDNKIWASSGWPDASISFYGHWGDNALDFALFNNAVVITPGQYVFNPSRSFSAELWPNGTLSAGVIHYNYIAGTPLGATTTSGSGQITITEVNADFIKGSFYFITAVNPSTSISMTVTNGEFHIKR